MYKCKHFKLYELVPKKVYEDRGEKGWELLDTRILTFIDYLRVRFGPIIINDWYFGGNNQWRGLRTPDSPYHRPYSQHTFGRAFDLSFKGVTAEEVREWLSSNVDQWESDTQVDSITCEDDVSWLHIDVRNNFIGYNSFKP